MASVIETYLREAHGHIKALELLVSVLERGAEDETHERRVRPGTPALLHAFLMHAPSRSWDSGAVVVAGYTLARLTQDAAAYYWVWCACTCPPHTAAMQRLRARRHGRAAAVEARQG